MEPLDDRARELYLAILLEGGRLTADRVDAARREPLNRLLALGLVVSQPTDASYSAVNPRAVGGMAAAALRAAANRRLRTARQVEHGFDELARAWEQARGPVNRPSTVQHVYGVEQIRHRILQLIAESTREVLAAQPGGARPAVHLAGGLASELGFLARGGIRRTLYQPGARTDAATAGYCATVTAAGARIRVLDEDFQRLFVFDRSIAVIAAAGDNSSAAFVEDPSAVAVLVDLFERDWRRAERVQWETLPAVTGGGPETDPGSDPCAVHETVARLLATGLTQRVVAGRLGLSERTVAGHIARLREEYEAETLFQLGWLMRGRED